MARRAPAKATSRSRTTGGRRAEIRIDGIPFPLPQTTPAQRARAARLLAALSAEYPDAHCELDYANPHELLIATILSAQSTDVGVNKATPALFRRFRTPADYAAATPEEIEPYVRSLGFFRNKARAIHLAMKAVVEEHGGRVPRTMVELLSLHGVARKTANVVLGNAFGINDGVVVDTHVERLAVRLGLVEQGTSVQMIERRLMALFPRDRWCDLSHLLIFHGRRACKARGPGCEHAICREFGIGCELRSALPAVKQAAKDAAKPATAKPGVKSRSRTATRKASRSTEPS